MTEQAEPAEPAAARSRWPLRGFLTAVFIVIAGPPVGALLLAGPLYIQAGRHAVTDLQPEALHSEFQVYMSVVYLMVLFSHVVGGIQALLAAIWLGIRTYLRGTFGYGEAVLAALVVSTIWAFRFGSIEELSNLPRLLNGDLPGGGLQLMLIGLSVGSALICRWLLRVVRILPG